MMKNLRKLFSMTMLVCMAVALFSCSKDEEESTYSDNDLIGEWTIIDAEIIVIGSDIDAKTYPENSVLMFSSDNTYKFITQPANVAFEEGSWALEGKNVILTNKLTKMGKSYEIKALTDEGSTLYHEQTSKVGDSEVGYKETMVLGK